MKIILEITPHEDGVHCGQNCPLLALDGCEDDVCAAFRFREEAPYLSREDYRSDDEYAVAWNIRYELGSFRPKDCLAAEREYAELEQCSATQEVAIETAIFAVKSLKESVHNVTAERDAMAKALDGMCEHCAIGTRTGYKDILVNCEHRRGEDVAVYQCKRNGCPHWQFDAGKVG